MSCQSCGSNACSAQHHHHHGHHQCGCDCHTGCQCSCHQGKQQCQCHEGHYADQLLHLADEAWMEVVKDAIKEQIIKHSGAHIKKLAELVSSTNHKRWCEKLGERKAEDDYADRLKDLMSSQRK